MTQEQLAELMKISVTCYGRLEHEEKTINQERLNEITQPLDVSAAHLLEEATADKEAKAHVSSAFFWNR